MSSEWLKVMLEEIERKQAEAEQARAEERARAEAQQRRDQVVVKSGNSVPRKGIGDAE
jgi:hypothetical protein